LFCIKYLKTADVGHSKGDEQQQPQQQNLSDDLNVESTTSSSLNKIISEEDLKSPYLVKTYFKAFFFVFSFLCSMICFKLLICYLLDRLGIA